jgi:hypothetical protein
MANGRERLSWSRGPPESGQFRSGHARRIVMFLGALFPGSGLLRPPGRRSRLDSSGWIILCAFFLAGARIHWSERLVKGLRAGYWFAEDHQQYLSDCKNPNGYCGLESTGAPVPSA